MKFARIRFPSRDVAVRAYYELARRGKIVSLREGQFIVPKLAVAWLESEGVTHEVLEWLPQDHVTQALRDSAADKV